MSNKESNCEMLDAALAYAKSGLSVIPTKTTDKRPHWSLLPEGKWEDYKSQIALLDEVKRWFGNGHKVNVSIVCGQVSGGLFCMDFDVALFYDRWLAAIGSLPAGLAVQRTGKGYHVIGRVDGDPGGNQKLAFTPDDDEDAGRRVAIETRGEGGYFQAAPSVHESGRRYELVSGALTALSPISQEVYDALLGAARRLDEAPRSRQQLEAEARRAKAAPIRDQAGEGISVIEAYNQAHTIEEELERHGYSPKGNGYVRPGGEYKTVNIIDGKSYHHNTNDALCDGYRHDAFDVRCLLDYGGDVRCAVREVAAELGIKPPAQLTQRTASPVGSDVDEALGQAGATPEPIDYQAMIESAKAKTRAEWPEAVGAIAKALASECELVVDQIANDVKAAGLASKGAFMASVKAARAKDRQAKRRGLDGKALNGTAQASVGYPSKVRLLTRDYINLYREWEINARLNLAGNIIEIAGTPLDDPHLERMRANVRDYGILNNAIVSTEHATEALTIMAEEDAYHPIKEYLEGLVWDGQDHIGKLASYFTDTKKLFHRWLEHWVCAAVARLYEGYQSPVLTLGGQQGLGKSFFAEWICPIQRYFLRSVINPRDKDTQLRLAGVFIWEVEELGATTRKADAEDLKAFFTWSFVTNRRPYGRMDLTRRVMASFIGTVNPGAGFLVDRTGNRRFLTCNIAAIDFSYVRLVDKHQVWAQAFAMWRNRAPWQLIPDEEALRNMANDDNLTVDPVEDWIDAKIVFTGKPGDMIQSLHLVRLICNDLNVQAKATEMAVAAYMAKRNVEKKQRALPDGTRPHSYIGIRLA